MHAIEAPQKSQIMIAEGNIFDNGVGPLMVGQTSNAEENKELAQIQRKIDNNEYALDDSDSNVSARIEDVDDKPYHKNPADLFFATEIETNYEAKKPLEDLNDESQERDKTGLSQHTYHDEHRALIEKKLKNNMVISNQVALVNQQDKYLHMDQKIFDNYNKQVQDRGWTRSRRSAAKLPPTVLFGLHRSGSQGFDSDPSARRPSFMNKRTAQSSMQQLSRGGAYGAKNRKPPKSKQSGRTGHSTAAFSNPMGLGFSAQDVNSMGINIDKMAAHTAFSANFRQNGANIQ